MAAIAPRTTYPERSTVNVVWPLVTENDTFTATHLGSRYPDRVVTVQGTFGSATVNIQGSVDGTNYATLTGKSGPLTFTSAAVDVIVENTPYLKVTHSGGSSESITVTVIGEAYR